MEFEALVAEANQKGLTVVNTEEVDELIEELVGKVREADGLCEIVDPENKPFDSKYKARDILDKFLQRLEATRTVSRLEGKTAIVDLLSEKIASLQVRVGSISWDCEEPQSAQKELDIACEYYFPGLVAEILEKVGSKDEIPAGEDSVLPEYETFVLPTLPTQPKKAFVEALKCLNILGILWAGRGRPHRSLLYLLCSETLYKQQPPSLSPQEEGENTYTHTLFYLAQAYGNFHDAVRSSDYCHRTLSRQLGLAGQGLKDVKSALDWVKNCMGIADFYRAMDRFKESAMALASAEKVFTDKVIVSLYQELDSHSSSPAEGGPKPHQKPNFVSGSLNAAEIEADLHRRWALLDTLALSRASDQFRLRQLDNLPPAAPASASEGDEAEEEVEFFSGFKVVIKGAQLWEPGYVTTFEPARKLFLRAVSRLENAKKYYLLDGYVTDHVALQQEHARLFHLLATFEVDYKRVIAMENRRYDMLLPYLDLLSKSSFETLHKQLSYELGEVVLGLLDLKLDRMRGKTETIKKAEIAKVNDLARMGLVLFGHFIAMYHNDSQPYHFAPLLIQADEATKTAYPLSKLAVSLFRENPDVAQITAEEVRPFLNAHFLSCRFLSKVIAVSSILPSKLAADKGFYLVCCLKRYEWLLKFAPNLCERRGLAVENREVFGEELGICRDMVGLLPAKINRMCYQGEGGLSL